MSDCWPVCWPSSLSRPSLQDAANSSLSSAQSHQTLFGSLLALLLSCDPGPLVSGSQRPTAAARLVEEYQIDYRESTYRGDIGRTRTTAPGSCGLGRSDLCRDWLSRLPDSAREQRPAGLLLPSRLEHPRRLVAPYSHRALQTPARFNGLRHWATTRRVSYRNGNKRLGLD
jgi:hypothetical protein